MIPKFIYFTPFWRFLKHCYLTFVTASWAGTRLREIMARRGHSSARVVSFLLPFHAGTWMQFWKDPWPPPFSLSRRIIWSILLPILSISLSEVLFFCIWKLIHWLRDVYRADSEYILLDPTCQSLYRLGWEKLGRRPQFHSIGSFSEENVESRAWKHCSWISLSPNKIFTMGQRPRYIWCY